jgi:membrane associated rhomboid family serine protease
MLLIVPYSTDAPIYHYPKATLGLIAVNVAIHSLWWFGPEEVLVPYAMRIGEGLHPFQWLSHNFIHIDVIHLIGNMVFLWSYGIIVEGKIGWLAFIPTYLGIGTLHGAAIQFAYLHAEKPNYVLGASAIIFGLLAIAMIWAPVNDLSCFYLIIVFFRIFSNTFEAPIWVFALLQLFLEGMSMVLTFMVYSDPMSSAFLHISGAFWGLIFGIALVKLRWVDCEGFDVFSLRKKRQTLGTAWKDREKRLDRAKQSDKLPKSMRQEEDRPELSPEERTEKLLAKVRKAVDAGDMATANATFRKWMNAVGDRAPRAVLLEVIQAMHARQEWVESVPAMRALCRLHPEKSEKVRMKLAHVLIRNLTRPAEARRHLDQISEARLDPNLRAIRRQLLEDCDRMIEEGVLELEEDG